MATLSSSKRVSYLLSMLSLLYILDSLSRTVNDLNSQYLFSHFSVFRIRSASILVLLSFYVARLILDSILLRLTDYDTCQRFFDAFSLLTFGDVSIIFVRSKPHGGRTNIFSVVRLFQHLSSAAIAPSFARRKAKKLPCRESFVVGLQ